MFSAVGTKLRGFANKDGRGYPDWAMRYLPVVRALRRDGCLDGLLLEVGANENGIRRFVDARTVAVDVSIDHLHAARSAQGVLAVVADAAALPFVDGAFAGGVCMDTLEHIPVNRRDRVCDELIRVVRSTGVAVVGFPAGAAAERAESVIRAAHTRFTGGTIRWLDEHEEEGLPDTAHLTDHITRTVNGGRNVRCTGNANVYVWRATWRVLACGWPGRGNALFQAALRLMTPALSRLHFGTCYRTMIWVSPRS